MIVISDSSPIRGLIQVGYLHLLKNLYSSILIPQGVFDELSVLPERGISISEITNAGWIKIQPVQPSELLLKLALELDRGEAEAIALAIEIKADILLIDERAGRKTARQFGFRIIGLFGVLLEAKKQRLVDEIKPIINELVGSGNFWASESLINTTLRLAGEM